MKPKTRGGKRAGAGRKSLGKIKLLIAVSPECVCKIREEAERRGASLGEVVEERFYFGFPD